MLKENLMSFSTDWLRDGPFEGMARRLPLRLWASRGPAKTAQETAGRGPDDRGVA